MHPRVDALFLQEVLRRNGTATVLLPFPAPDFKKVSVGEGWASRFDTVLSDPRVEVKPPLFDRLVPEGEQPAAFEKCNAAIIAEAERLARLFDDAQPVLLTVWNGNPGSGRGGTADMVTMWKGRGHEHENIDVGTT